MGSFEDAKRRAGVLKAQRWLSARSQTEKTGLAVFVCCLVLLLLYVVIEDHDSLFVMAETVHFIGIGWGSRAHDPPLTATNPLSTGTNRVSSRGESAIVSPGRSLVPSQAPARVRVSEQCGWFA